MCSYSLSFLFDCIVNILCRSILHNWRKSLHIPLRLDIYYEYQTLSQTETNSDGTPAVTTRKDLLERWCIDYIPTFDSPSSSPSSSNHKSFHHSTTNFPNQPPPPPPLNQPVKRSNSMDETILQLRQVVKRVIIFLRVLNSFTRMMPGYKLHHALMVEKEFLEQKILEYQRQQQQKHYHDNNYNPSQYNMYNPYYGNRLEGGGPGLTGGYYANNAQQQHYYHGQQQQQQFPQPTPQSLSSEKRNLIGGSIKFLFCVSSDPVPTTNSSSMPLSPAEQRDLNLTQQRLFSSTTNSPFTRHDLSPIPTPYGTLYFTALYDESLNVERVMMNRAQRLMEWDRIMSSTVDNSSSSADNGMAMSRAIPIKTHDGSLNNSPSGSMSHAADTAATRRHSSYQPQQPTFSNALSYHHQSYIHQDHHQQQQQQAQPMSLPNNFISNHLIHNYAKSPVEPSSMSKVGSRSNLTEGSIKCDTNENAQQLRDRMRNDPNNNGEGLKRRNSGGKRVLSGLSLALMNDQQDDESQHQLQQQSQQETPQSDQGLNNNAPNFSSSSPTIENPMKAVPALSQSPIPPAASIEEAASWKQRVALHHPPPSFDIPSSVSESPSNHGLMPSNNQQQTQQVLAPGHKFGYGYNNGKVIPMPIHNFRDTNSPSPIVPLVNTPPQPMFIGSFPRHSGVDKGNDTKEKEECNTSKSPPFRNPDSLQDISSTGVDSTNGMQSYLQPIRQGPTGGVSGFVSTNTKVLSQGQGGQSINTTENLLLPPLTKSDGLASSPFKFPIPGSNPNGNSPYNTGSAFSSLTLGKGSAMAFGQEVGAGLPLSVTSGVFGGSVGNISSMDIGRSGSEHMFRNSGHSMGLQDNIDAEDMPFAVDTDELMITSTGGNSTGPLKQSSNHDHNVPLSLSSGTVSSQVVTSFAHRCATAQPLQLFNSSANVLDGDNNSKSNTQGNSIEKSMDALTSQLDDFKSFGESIMMSST